VVLAGNVGSSDRQSYALVGDTVNTASRVAGLCKKFETDILISEATARRLSRKLDLKALEPVPVKGRQEAIVVYKV